MDPNNPQETGGTGDLPQPVIKRRSWSDYLIWLLPLLVAVIGLSLLIHGWLARGPSIEITFQTADGLDTNKTQVKYKNVVIGTASNIRLSPDRDHVVVTVDLNDDAAKFATKGSRFWVVRPRIGAGGVSGVGTLFSGSFIAADVGDSQTSETHFKGLETPPSVLHGVPGRQFVLHADDLGSLDIGSPIYYRRIQVGHVASYQLDPDGKHVSLGIFVDSPNDRYVTTDTRFWNASGVDLSLGSEGLKVQTQSLTSIIAGGIAFGEPLRRTQPAAAEENASFQLFSDESTAMAPPDGPAMYVRFRFPHPMRGLKSGAAVEFLGINVGKVVNLGLSYDASSHTFPQVAGALIYPMRLGKAYDQLQKVVGKQEEGAAMGAILAGMIQHGLRAQARSANLLTGQLYIAIDFVPHTDPVAFDPNQQPLELPTVPGNLDHLQEQVGEIVAKVDKMPFQQIGDNLNQSLAGLSALLKNVNGNTLPELKKTMVAAQHTMGTADSAFASDSPLQQGLGGSLHQLQRAAESLRSLTDYLGRYPQALLRGRPADPEYKPTPAAQNNATPRSQP
ncbi:PqiB family protein [Frateuria aurantia]